MIYKLTNYRSHRHPFAGLAADAPAPASDSVSVLPVMIGLGLVGLGVIKKNWLAALGGGALVIIPLLSRDPGVDITFGPAKITPVTQ